LSDPKQGSFVVEDVGRSPSPQEPIALICIWQVFGDVAAIEGDLAIYATHKIGLIFFLILHFLSHTPLLATRKAAREHIAITIMYEKGPDKRVPASTFMCRVSAKIETTVIETGLWTKEVKGNGR
jgi:hypothetical protein